MEIASTVLVIVLAVAVVVIYTRRRPAPPAPAFGRLRAFPSVPDGCAPLAITLTIVCEGGEPPPMVRVDWGDGSAPTVCSFAVPPSHQFTSAGTYNFTVEPIYSAP